jgi:type VI secretion system protein ImpK
MSLARHQTSFLLSQFREFYREVARLKEMVAYSAPVSAAEEMVLAAVATGGPGPGPGFADADPNVAPERAPGGEAGPSVRGVWQQLLSLLERQAVEAGRGGAFAYEVYREAQYVMAALADEVFLHLDWEGKSTWPLLESRLFETHYAGEEIFFRLDRLLQRRDPFYLDLAAVYFMALSLGFQGKYRGHDDRERLEYRRQLFKQIYRRDPKLFGAAAPLFPQSYQNTLDKAEVTRLPAQWTWLWLIAAVILLWIVGSQYAWSSATSRVECLICQVLQSNCPCEAK